MLRCGLDLSGELLALAAASHSGEDFHVAGVRRILAGAGLTEDALQCPPDLPLDEDAQRAMILAGAEPDRVHMNCSGKHAAMLATCVAAGWPTADLPRPRPSAPGGHRGTGVRAGRRAGGGGRRGRLRRAAAGDLRDWPGPGVPRGGAGRAGHARAPGRRRDARLPGLDLGHAPARAPADGGGARPAAEGRRRGRGRVRAGRRPGGGDQDRGRRPRARTPVTVAMLRELGADRCPAPTWRRWPSWPPPRSSAAAAWSARSGRPSRSPRRC